MKIKSSLVFFAVMTILWFSSFSYVYGEDEERPIDHTFHYHWTQDMLDKAISQCEHPGYIKKLWINSIENRGFLICKDRKVWGKTHPFIYLNDQWTPYKGKMM